MPPDTPRTDAIGLQYDSDAFPRRMTDLARTLERENAALREAADRYVDHMRPYMQDQDCPVCERLMVLLRPETHQTGVKPKSCLWCHQRSGHMPGCGGIAVNNQRDSK